MSDTITTALTLAYSLLNGDATFTGYLSTWEGTPAIFQDIAEAGATDLWCVIGIQSPGNDVLTSFAERILSDPMLRILISGPAKRMADISAAYARADAVLCPDGEPTRNAGGTLALYRVSPLYLPGPTLIAGKPWVNLGGLYRNEM